MCWPALLCYCYVIFRIWTQQLNDLCIEWKIYRLSWKLCWMKNTGTWWVHECMYCTDEKIQNWPQLRFDISLSNRCHYLNLPRWYYLIKPLYSLCWKFEWVDLTSWTKYTGCVQKLKLLSYYWPQKYQFWCWRLKYYNK